MWPRHGDILILIPDFLSDMVRMWPRHGDVLTIIPVEDISRPRPVQLIDPKIFCFLSSPRPSLVQLNRPLTDFPDKDSVEVIQDSLNDTVEVVVAYGSLPDTAEVVIIPRFAQHYCWSWSLPRFSQWLLLRVKSSPDFLNDYYWGWNRPRFSHRPCWGSNHPWFIHHRLKLQVQLL